MTGGAAAVAMQTETGFGWTPLDSHPLHGSDRIWGETNCYVDLWIELLNALGLDPHAALAFTVGIDFEGDQWTFFKYPLEDLRLIYGLEVQEYAVWRPLEDHFEEQIRRGRFLIAEVDSWFLPDTHGTAYRRNHGKTSIAVRAIDRTAKRVAYYHGPGAYEAQGEDYEGLMQTGRLPPYVEIVKLDGLIRRDGNDLRALALGLVAEHQSRRRPGDAMGEFLESLSRDIAWLTDSGDLDRFHSYSFATMRQLGANAELASSFFAWLGGHDRAVAGFAALAEAAKQTQFKLARAAAGRAIDLSETQEGLRRAWRESFDGLR